MILRRLLKKCLGVFLLSAFCSVSLFAQQKTVTGQVLDEQNEPLIGVAITLKGTKTGTLTDINGRFSVNVPSDNTVLVFSYLGFATQEVLVGNRTSLSVNLSTSESRLSEVVVVGYGTQVRSDITGSIAGVNADELTRNTTNDVLSAMQGKIAGVQISSESGEIGSGMNIIIRGANSIYGGTSPLFVIDGVQMEMNQEEMATAQRGSSSSSNPMANLNPNDIESIEVLKDASATAIYGSRGANGVVIVTTKSGKDGKSVIDYSGWASLGTVSETIDVLHKDQYLDYLRTTNPTSPILVDPISGVDRDFTNIPNRDWQDELYVTAFSQNHSVNVSGGNKATRFSGGLGYLSEDGLVRNNTSDRYTMRLRIDHEHSKKLKVGLNLNTSFNQLEGATGSGGGGTAHGSIQRIAFSRPIDVADPNNDEDGIYVSPIDLITNAYRVSTLFKGLVSTYAEYKITDDLIFNTTVAGSMSNSKGKEFYGATSAWGRQTNGYAGILNRFANNWIITNRLNYNKRFNADHNLGLMAAYEVGQYNFERGDMANGNFFNETTGVDDIGAGSSLVGLTSFRERNSRISYLGRANYNMFNRYLFTVSMRADGSSKFFEGSRWGYFPSAAFAWQVANEEFMKSQNVISNLKLRLSYGVTGNDRIPSYRPFANYGTISYGDNNGYVIGYAPDNAPNPGLQWETTYQYNAGVDFGILNNRVEITADYYNKQTEDMLFLVPISTHTGYWAQWQNRGSIENKGIELGIRSRNIDKGDFGWNTDFNISFNKNKVKDLGGAQRIPIDITLGPIASLGAIIVGQPLGTGFGYVFDGVYQIEDFTWQGSSDPSIPHEDRNYVLKPDVVSVSGNTVHPGSFKFRDLNGDNIVDDEFDRQVISNSQPKFYGGFNNQFRYKKFDLNVFLEFNYGRTILNHSQIGLQGFRSDNLTTEMYNNHWTPENPTNEYGGYANANPDFGNATFALNNSYYVEDASYVRLRGITLGYNFAGNSLKKMGLNNVRLYLSGNNLHVWTKYSGLDPEVNFNNPLLSGLDRLAYPRARTFIFGVNVTL